MQKHIGRFQDDRKNNLQTWSLDEFLDWFVFFVLFNEIECKKGRTRMMQPLSIANDPCITEEKGKLIKWEGEA